MMKNTLFIAVCAVISVPASAQEFPGGHLEALVGYDSLRGAVAYTDSAFPEDNFSADESTNGVVFGVAGGYDVRMLDGWYVGIEGSFDFADNQRCEEIFGSDAACFDVGNNYAVGGRVGTRLASNAMLYVGAAFVSGEAEISYEDQIDPSNNFTLSDRREGYRLSTGIERRLTGMMFAKVEYRYSDYGDYDLADGTERISLGFDRHHIVGGVGFRF
jgi:outer membrane immunogenic protein